jgi:hypothetical protein
LALLFRPFFSPVHGVRDARMLHLRSLRSFGFCTAFEHRACRKGVFSPVIWAKTGERALPVPPKQGVGDKPSAGFPAIPLAG